MITTREQIAAQADEAAAAWTRNPRLPKPANPYDSEVMPEHAAAWRCAFERALLVHSCPEGESCEGSA